ncbi:MAG: hypothetical protein KDD38_00860 [Bdellovibrionales bacterium]|nr:hypothetical protein [Bdellovibrionales bacterium]
MKKQLPILRERIVSNWLYKLIALMVALSIWITTLQGRKDFVRFKSLDVEFLVNPSFVVIAPDDHSIKLQISGSRMSLGKLNQTSQILSMNLLGESPGRKRIEVKPSDISLPPGVKLISIQPRFFDIEIKKVVSP